MTNFWIAIQFTIFGMFLIFSSLLIIWGILTLLVIFLANQKRDSGKENKGDVSTTLEISEEEINQEAVAVAVSVAFAQKSLNEPGRFPLPPTAIVSAWQAVLRSYMIAKRGMPR